MMITTLGGPAMNFKGSIDAYRQAATEAGFDASPKSLPVSTASLFYTAETTQDAMREFYPHLNTGMSFIRGVGYPKQQFANSSDYREALMVGSRNKLLKRYCINTSCMVINVLWHSLILAVCHLKML